MFLRHRTFIGPRMFPARGTREAVRLIAQRFANDIGAESVITVAEHSDPYGPFSIVIWFKSVEGERGMSSRVHVTNAEVRAIIQNSPDGAFPVDPASDAVEPK